MLIIARIDNTNGNMHFDIWKKHQRNDFDFSLNISYSYCNTHVNLEFIPWQLENVSNVAVFAAPLRQAMTPT